MHYRPPDAIAIAALPLIGLAFWSGGVVFPTVCLCFAGAVIIYVIAGHEELAWKQRVAIGGITAALDFAAVFYLYKVDLAEELRLQAAPLIAASLPSPVSSNCPIPRGAVALYLGNMVSVVTEFPHVVFRVRGEAVLVLERNASGVLLSFAAFDDRGNVVGLLNRNAFHAIHSAAHVERPSPSNLVVFENRENKVLDVQFLNPQAVKVTGILRYPGVDPIVIGEKYLGTGGSISPPSCRSGAGVDFLRN